MRYPAWQRGILVEIALYLMGISEGTHPTATNLILYHVVSVVGLKDVAYMHLRMIYRSNKYFEFGRMLVKLLVIEKYG